MDNDPDRRRIASYLAGEDEAAQEVDAWIRREIEICYPTLWSEADDIRQAVHGKLLENLRAARFQHRSRLKTYIGRITHHTAIDRIRRKRRERSVPADWRIEIASTGENPYRSLAALEEQDQMDQVLLRSPAPCRELWRLVFLEKLSYAEIGRRLSIPPGTVKSRMWHCRRKALALLEQLQRGSRKARRGGEGG